MDAQHRQHRRTQAARGKISRLGEREGRARSAQRVLALLQQSPLGEATLAGGTGWLAAARTETPCRSRPWLFWSPWSGRQEKMWLFQLPVCSSVVLNFTRLKSTVLYLAVSPPARHDLDLDVSPSIPCPHGGNRTHSHACHILAPSLPTTAQISLSSSPSPTCRPRPTTHGPRPAPSHLPPPAPALSLLKLAWSRISDDQARPLSAPYISNAASSPGNPHRV